MRLQDLPTRAGISLPGAKIASKIRAVTHSGTHELPPDHYQGIVNGFGVFNLLTENRFVDALEGSRVRNVASWLCVSAAASCQLSVWVACAPLLGCKVAYARVRHGREGMDKQITQNCIPLTAGLFVADVLLVAALLVLAWRVLRAGF